MKFAALVLLLVVGSQAASLQADAPDHFQMVRDNLREGAKRVLSPFDTTAHKASKDNAIDTVDAALGSMLDMAKTLFASADDATSEIRARVSADIQQLKLNTADDIEKVKTNILNHVQEYLSVLQTLREYLDTKKDEVDALKAKITEAAASLGEKVPKNWEETKASLLPLLTKVQEFLVKYSEEVKQQAMPHLTEYMETAQKHADNPDALMTELKAKMATLSAMVESLGKN